VPLPPPALLPLPPQPIPAPTTSTNSRPNSVGHRLFFPGTPKKTSNARTTPPAPVRNLFLGEIGDIGERKAALAAVVVTVTVAFTAVVLVTTTVVGEALHATPAAVFDTEHVSATFPVKPPDGVTATVAVPDEPAAMLTAPLLLNAYVGFGTTVAVTMMLTVAVVVTLPLVAVTVAV